MRACFVLCLWLLSTALQASEPRQLSWEALIPAGSVPAPMPMQPLHDLSQLAQVLSEQGPAATQSARREPVVAELDGQHVKMPGYIVPLETGPDGRVNEFLLVPFFGACIHVPPPPSNQIVHAYSELGVHQEALWQPYWVEGLLRVEHTENELADSGYKITAYKVYNYALEDQ